MATYAAFKHVELYNVGKTKKRVLRPPGGGTSDIFGGDLPQTPRNVKNHMQSNIFSCDKNGAIKNNGDQPRRGQQKVDSYQRLFGEPERPNTPARNHMKSSIPFGSNTEAAQELLANGNGHHSNGKGGSVSTSTSSSVSSSTENLKMNGVSKLDGNPVTGEGYKPSNSFNNAVPSLNGANQVINKNRIPPGGFSSGLW
ncbi:microtubule-associated protein Jupiter isoform X12 [Bactrocera oleae]|uniref:microtubule-associated protein Jupiter isoform X12 n=1 Tax=Bactrocera oleae TaxID=104688 RepID=UPI00174E6E77|nr:microtubule-associated protein Jupiter isoform X4 [Bactrocera oleae]XP_036228930.1 microtubule-associated protein Jupiter isoform X4 [Bactrocera oleae]XP_036228931.1 microtubule-associated protein Jupiter isoform X4 [Bactrocera oleae]